MLLDDNGFVDAVSAHSTLILLLSSSIEAVINSNKVSTINASFGRYHPLLNAPLQLLLLTNEPLSVLHWYSSDYLGGESVDFCAQTIYKRSTLPEGF